MQTRIIEFLKNSDGYLSGEEISRKLNISRAGIWKNMQELRKKGYSIEAVPHKGYVLKSAPDKLFPQEITSELQTKYIGQNLVHYDSIGSTMDEAFKFAMDECVEGTVVCAEEQAKGRGRMGRDWSSTISKGIYTSIVLKPNLVATDVAKLTLLTGVAVYEAVKKVSDIGISIKWPNDLMVGDKKLCGILTEMNAQMEQVKFVIVGIGINVNHTKNELLPEAVSIKTETGEEISRVKLLREILISLEYWYELMLDQGFDPVIKKWKEYTSTLNRRIRLNEIEGKAIDLDEFGGLVIETDDGMVVKRMSGDVMELN